MNTKENRLLNDVYEENESAYRNPVCCCISEN